MSEDARTRKAFEMCLNKMIAECDPKRDAHQLAQLEEALNASRAGEETPKVLESLSVGARKRLSGCLAQAEEALRRAGL